MTTSAAVRQKLVTALSLDLVGPDSQAADHYQDDERIADLQYRDDLQGKIPRLVATLRAMGIG